MEVISWRVGEFRPSVSEDRQLLINERAITWKNGVNKVRPSPQYYKHFLTFRFAIEHFNNSLVLPNITLGYHVYDSCSDGNKAIKSVLQILSGPGRMVPNYSCTERGKVIGFIGDHHSVTTVPIAQLLGVYPYSQISYGATPSVLGDRQLYPTFFQTIQNDRTVYSMLSKVLEYFGWTWIGILASNDDSGETEAELLTNHLTKRGICVAFTIKISFDQYNNKDWINAEVIRKSTAKVIVLCGMFSQTFRKCLGEMKSVLSDRTIVLNPNWASNKFLMDELLNIFNGSLLHRNLKNFIVSLPDGSHIGFDENGDFVSSYRILNWVMTEKLKVITRDVGDLIPSAKEDRQLLINESAIIWKNGVNQSDMEMFHLPISTMKYHKSLSCSPESKDETCFKKEEIAPLQLPVGRILGLIYYDNLPPQLLQLVLITLQVSIILGFLLAGGLRKKEKLKPLTVTQQEYHILSFHRSLIPVSRCSEMCLPGSRKIPRPGIHPCCYDCAPCSEGEISNTTDSEICIKCQGDEWPNEKRDLCIPKSEDFLSYTNDEISAVFISVSVFFCFITQLILGIFISHRDTPIVKANNKNLSFLLLVSIMLSFLCVFLFLGRPVDITCMLRQISFGILFSIAVSSVLAKTIMVCIAFRATKPGSVWRKWMGVKLPNCVVCICSSVQVVISISWLSISPPFQELDTHSYEGQIIVQCNEGSVIGFYSVLGYMGVLAAVSFITAFIARTLPDSFNEAKYITFSMLVFCSVWIAMIPAYLSTKGKYMVAVEIFSILTSNAGLLGCIFLPKCYIILCRPELNTKLHLLDNRRS
ncbi:vomeronasal type-2 receptor 26-like [Mixophyes fleayi]|uniref:vomeronasal type-2 receptor 26-like n=1 Tax=Mixophyes fleayi TaxID=3061075 RepID=UPI003F4E02AA